MIKLIHIVSILYFVLYLLLNKLYSVVTKTAIKLDQYEEKLNEMETKLDDVKERIVEVEKAKPMEAAWVKTEVKNSFADAAKQTIPTQSFCLDKTNQSHTKSRQNNLHSVHSKPCRIKDQSGPK